MLHSALKQGKLAIWSTFQSDAALNLIRWFSF